MAGVARPAQGKSDAAERVTKSAKTYGEDHRFSSHKEDAIGRASKTTLAKREREKALQMHRKEKEAKRALRKVEKSSRRSTRDGEDPDLAGLHWGPQAPLY